MRRLAVAFTLPGRMRLRIVRRVDKIQTLRKYTNGSLMTINNNDEELISCLTDQINPSVVPGVTYTLRGLAP